MPAATVADNRLATAARCARGGCAYSLRLVALPSMDWHGSALRRLRAKPGSNGASSHQDPRESGAV